MPKLTPRFRVCMDDILALYTEPLPAGHELHCFDEMSKQLLGTPRGGQTCAPGQERRLDYEYTRNGTRNLFVAVAPFIGTRTVRVTKQRCAADTADFLWRYCMIEHASAKHLHLVVDNLNTHKEGCLRKVWSKAEADQFFARVTFHYTPAHASWLNMAELEICGLRRQGLKARIDTEDKLIYLTAMIEARRNDRQCTFNWKFDKTKAREKFPQLYVSNMN